MIRYEESGIDPRILRAVQEMGYEEMTPIQARAIPVMMTGADMIGQAQTGTGKTAAFGIPLLQMIDPENRKLQAVVLCPTRELAIQAADELRKLAKFMHGIKVLPVYGGQEITRQIRALKSEVQIIVGTPGRVMDHMRRHTIRLNHVKLVVLDEADEMLNMGFREDMETILGAIEGKHQTVLFSATMPKPILEITKHYQKNAVMVKVPSRELTVPLVKQYYYEVHSRNKQEVTCRLLDYYALKRTLIFCNTKKMVDELTESLKGRNYFAEGLHGDMSQAQRDKVMHQFKSGVLEVLIATDVAARGIDVDDVEAVINYDVPQDIEYYVHRIGRTGRAGKKGRSFTLVVGREIYKIREIEQICKTRIKAKTVPSVRDVTTAKADKILKEALELLRGEEELTAMKHIIERKLDEEDITAMELAAAFLKVQMGEEPEEIPPVERKSRRSSEKHHFLFKRADKKEEERYGKKMHRDHRKGIRQRRPRDRREAGTAAGGRIL
ncbi:MAG: DEAD/DEAH box helicase [Lachnospiraceae bacterium]|nr:DEAD/DEAH box helicase [Lachnospiraceae bacterium]